MQQDKNVVFILPNGEFKSFREDDIYEGVYTLEKEIKSKNTEYASLNDIDHMNGVTLFELSYSENTMTPEYYAAYEIR